MKRAFCMIALSAAMLAAGIGEAAVPSAVGGSVRDVLEQQMAAYDGVSGPDADAPAGAEAERAKQPASPDAKYDVDLTLLSSTMLYSEVFNMMSAPEDYVGRTVRTNGQFAFYQAPDEEGRPIPDQMYFACVMADAAACCSQGLEFVLAGEHSYPDDYPAPGADIVVSGVFETYEEEGFVFCRLADAVLE